MVWYRARLVAQGFRQKAYDSYVQIKLSAHKDSLRLFLSVCAAENSKIYQADVKAAFLQAPLDEKIFVKSPPGYDSVNLETGEEKCLGIIQVNLWFERKSGMLLVCYG